ncbi:MAG TPA: hypothetical protein VLX28_23885 [Thermoanaerobaculia bacterium]|nr:hypothetical protein [Thermoanaerobaculia bacterium]
MNLTPVLLAFLLVAQSPSQQQQQQKPKESFWQKVLRITGISATPPTTKGLPGGLLGGDLWMAGVDGGSRLRLTRDGEYRSPVFSADGGAVLALREGKVVRVSTAGFLDTPEPLFPVPGIVRLVGSDPEAPGQVVVLTRPAEGTADLGILDLGDRKVRSLSAEAPAAGYQNALAELGRWDRTWQIGEPAGTVRLEVRPVDRGFDVFYLNGASPIDVSHCGGDRCGQLAVSPDGRWVVFVRTPAPKP